MLMQGVLACDGCKGRSNYSFVDTKVTYKISCLMFSVPSVS